MRGTVWESPSFRASDADRERVVRLLRDSAVEGRLAHDSFVRRVDLALRARDQRALDDLVVDLPGSRRTGIAVSLRTRFVAVVDRLTAGSRASRLPTLKLPSMRQAVFVIGRRQDCDLVLSDPTVSRVHAGLRRFGDQWFLDDLGSTNGTRLNGYRVRTTAVLRPGDCVGLGRLTFRVIRAEDG
jgi:hypothetical protein